MTAETSASFFRTYQVRLLVGVAASGLAAGTLFWWLGHPDAAALAWALATTPVLVSLIIEIVRSLLRGDVGLDIVAGLSMTAALTFGEPLAANVVAVMYSGGQLLEAFAQGRASQEMSALMGRVARTAMCFISGDLKEVPITGIKPGDRLLIRHGEVLPVDGHVAGDGALLDLSALTGESVPQSIPRGGEVLSGSTAMGIAFEMIATHPAADSTYAGIVRLVAAAQASKAPMVRMADRFAIWFLLLTVAIAAVTWFATGDTTKVLAVLVVATPCPLILAVPVALIAGMSKAAGIGVLVKGGAVLEALSRVSTVILDKTGTLTHGQAAISRIETANGFSEADVLAFAAALDQASAHVVAGALISAATARGLALSTPEHVTETAGTGIEGTVAGRKVAVGGLAFVQSLCSTGKAGDASAPSGLHVGISIDQTFAGIIFLEDRIRAEAGAVLDSLRAQGVTRIVLASGDRREVADKVGASLAVDLVLAELTPEAKVAAVSAERGKGAVMMVGDGVNDAPALAAADVGVAMGARGTASSSEAAGVVLLVDHLQPLAKAIAIARRSRLIAIESVVAGLSLSIAAMIAAAFGLLQPVEGALLQEAIDVAVILNALRALR